MPLPLAARHLDEAIATIQPDLLSRLARAFTEIAADRGRVEVPVSPAIDVTWLPRHGARAGTTTALVDAVRDADRPKTVCVPQTRRTLLTQGTQTHDRVGQGSWWSTNGSTDVAPWSASRAAATVAVQPER